MCVIEEENNSMVCYR